ncbi:MAG: magnesium/cobalt transporter CorA [Planctomycetales bacterium]
MTTIPFMRRFRRPRVRRRTAPGAAPGVIRPDPQAPPPVIRLLGYGAGEIEEVDVPHVAELSRHLGKHAVTWINVDGLGDAETIAHIGRLFDLHPLALEDVVNVHQRPKVEEYGDYLFIVVRIVEDPQYARTEQISIFLGKDFVVTFQERVGDCWNPVRERLRTRRGRIRQLGPDYLVYTLIDAAVDAYFPVAEEYGDRLDAIEEDLSHGHAPQSFSSIQHIRSDLLVLRRAMAPLREAVNQLVRDPHALVTGDTRIYLRDCYDHTIQILDLLQTYREVCSDLREFYFAMVSQRTNEIMRVLTVIATLFMPLSFIAAVYGMNFDRVASWWNMPELGWRFGYPAALCLMAAVAVGQLTFFRRKGWLGSRKRRRRHGTAGSPGTARYDSR